MRVFLKSEDGSTVEGSFENMETAAKFCGEYPNFGIFLFPEKDEDPWKDSEWDEILSFTFS